MHFSYICRSLGEAIPMALGALFHPMKFRA